VAPGIGVGAGVVSCFATEIVEAMGLPGTPRQWGLVSSTPREPLYIKTASADQRVREERPECPARSSKLLGQRIDQLGERPLQTFAACVVSAGERPSAG